MTARRQVDERREAACPIIRAPDWTARISPACAGNTSAAGRAPAALPDQPRVRGEHIPNAEAVVKLPGSAPRARGTHISAGSPGRRRRISPACAGNTPGCDSTPTPAPDQPRVRGEHTSTASGRAVTTGSAPRARGTLDDVVRRLPIQRISPACAGNTASPTMIVTLTSDQPRVRGEHRGDTAGTALEFGSAPRARGTRDRGRQQHADQRISPACAGNTPQASPCPTGRSDQPRVRGEHTADEGIIEVAHGSAPRARGTRVLLPARSRGTLVEDCVAEEAGRISPACAGNTT